MSRLKSWFLLIIAMYFLCCYLREFGATPRQCFFANNFVIMFSSTVCLWFRSFLGIEELSMNRFSVFFSLCSMLLDKKFKSELVRLGAEAAVKLGTRSNRYETLLKQRHVQVTGSLPFPWRSLFFIFCLFTDRNAAEDHHLAHSGSQSQRRIWFILPTCGANFRINIFDIQAVCNV